jgi:hypothetical protein
MSKLQPLLGTQDVIVSDDFNRLYGPYYALKEKKRIRENRKLKLKKRYNIHHSNWRY